MTHAANVKTDLPAFEKFGRTINPSDDPTKTGGLRARWVAQVNKRWTEVQKFVTTSVVAEDFFGLRRDTPPGNPSQQIERFMAALVRVEKTTINEEKGGFIPWITPFVGEAFSKGMIRGNRDLAALARGQKREARTSTGNALRLVTNAELFEAPTLDPNNIQDALQAGERARLFEMEVTRTWQGITGVTAQVNAQVAAAIADGLETRATPRQMAKNINERIDAVGITRSQMIARTETVAANNRGAVAEFAEAQRLTGFEVHVQWETSLDSRVRDTHIVRHGDVYTKEAGLGLISEPNCRCALLPYIPAIEGDVDLSSGKAAKALTPKAAEKPAARERKKLDLPKGQVGKPVKRRAKRGTVSIPVLPRPVSKTIKEAETWARDNVASSVSYKGMDIQAANQANQAFYDINISANNGLKIDKIRTVKEANNFTDFMAARVNIKTGVSEILIYPNAQKAARGGEILSWANESQLEKHLKDSSLPKIWGASSTDSTAAIYDATVHELGHTMHIRMPGDLSWGASAFESGGKMTVDGLAKAAELSAYAQTSYAETVAESFTKYFQNPNSLSDELKTLVEAILKGAK